MRCFLSLAFIIGAAFPAFAQEAKPNSLTPKESAEGWLLLFDGETDFGWSGAMKVVEGTLQIKGGMLDKVNVRHNVRFQDFELHFDYLEKGPGSKCLFEIEGKGAGMGMNLPRHGDGESWSHSIISVQDKKCASKFYSLKASAIPEPEFGKVIPGSNQLVWIVPAGSSLSLKNVKLKPLGMTPLFNGKDLTGWKEFPGKKSKFTVTPQGEINIKDGPGDLQTESKYGDFVLQLECISNGKHLNSGVFFRCRPNEYQNGYEAQIRNQFTPEPTQDYVIEEYDPQTNVFIAKKKVKYTAVDYGTGAIYRRQPARKEVAKDGAWFTLTVVAQGNHLATFVDGIQVADWTDNRPQGDNARTGCRLEAGHISLQGHDPTTDLSFRNFRIGK